MSTDADERLEEILKEWKSLEQDLELLERDHQNCLSKLSEVQRSQKTCMQNVRQQRTRLAILKDSLKKCSMDELDKESTWRLRDLQIDLADTKTRLNNITEELPKESNGLYLHIILGSIDVSLTNKQDKFRYKDEYEKFKLVVQGVSAVVASLAFFFHFRVLDAVFQFLLVWFYCTLTIRESILRVNGSRIKGWWLFHHYLSTVLSGILLTWPDELCYRSFRRQFFVFSLYISLVQFLQCQYQRGCLYRLRALGQRHSMDITVDGFHSWMFKGLTFLLPFLVLGYLFELYNAFTLIRIRWLNECGEWQVVALALLFLVLAVGNSCTTAWVCYRKYRDQSKIGVRNRLQTKYSIAVSDEQADAIRKELFKRGKLE